MQAFDTFTKGFGAVPFGKTGKEKRFLSESKPLSSRIALGGSDLVKSIRNSRHNVTKRILQVCMHIAESNAESSSDSNAE